MAERFVDIDTKIIKETIDILQKHLREIPSSLEDEKIADFLRVLGAANRILMVGAGRSKLVAQFGKSWLKKLGIEVEVVDPEEEELPRQFGEKLGDVLIPISASGKTPSVIAYVSFLRERSRGILRLVPITSNPQGSGWDQNRDLIIHIPGRTKEDWHKEIKKEISQRTPLGTLSEFSNLTFLLAVSQALIEEKDKDRQKRVKEVILEFADELENSLLSIEKQSETLGKIIPRILETRNKSRVVFDGFGRVEKIHQLFAARLIQIYGFNPMHVRGTYAAKIGNQDTVIITSLSGEVAETLKTVNHCLEDRNLIPIYFTSCKDSAAGQLIAKEKAVGFYVPGRVVRLKRTISFSERQFISKAKNTPLDNSAELVLLAIFEGIFACLMERLGLKEENLLHPELE